MPGTSVEITFFRLIFVDVCIKVARFYLEWGIYERFGKKISTVLNTFFHLL